MADEKSESGEQQDAKKRGGLSLRAVIVVAAVLLLEGVTISGVFLLTGSPETAKADSAAVDGVAEAERAVEVMVVADKFQNTRTGRAYIYDTEVYVVCKNKNSGTVAGKLESMRARIATDIAEIFRKAEPAHLLEPELATLRRQINAALNQRLGTDLDGNAMVMEVLIPKCEQYRADM